MKGGDILNNSEFDHVEPVQAQYLEVKVHFGNFDKAMSAFRNMVQKERILSSYKEKQVFEKPSDKKRRKRNEMKRKLLELEMKDKYEERSDSKNTRNKQTRE
jgi:small subunit ribosomal protein S21